MGVNVREKPKGSGVWWIFINHQGKRKSKKIGKDEKLAREVAKKIEAKLILSDYKIVTDDKKAPVFKELSKEWLNTHIKQSRRETTYERYHSILNVHLWPKLKSQPIDNITRSEVIKVLRGIQGKELSRSTIEAARNVISGVAEYAIDLEYITENPTIGVIKRLGLKRRRSTEPIEVFTPDEVSIILEKCRSYRPDFYPLFLTAFRAGLRLGETLALSWDSINWRERYMMIKQSYRHGRVTPPKNGRPRRVDMSDQLHAELRRLYVQRMEEALKNGKNRPELIIFHTNGNYTSQNTVRNVWRRLLGKCKLDYRKCHTTRHTFASLLISKGESIAYIKEIMGHSSIQITVDIYGHLLPTEHRNSLNALDTPSCTLSAPTKNKNAATI